MPHGTMMILKSCPYCREAFRLMRQLEAENPEYAAVTFDVVDESEDPQRAASLDYWYVPSYFVNGEKLHEGVPTKAKLRNVYERALGRKSL